MHSLLSVGNESPECLTGIIPLLSITMKALQ